VLPISWIGSDAVLLKVLFLELKEMGANLGINAGGGLVAQLLVRPTYLEQILHA
jgi:hypothetical protein